MTGRTTKTMAVITGDIVASGKMPPADKAKLYADFKKMMVSLRREQVVAAFEIFRGDSVQCIVKEIPEALRTALLIRAWYKSYGSIGARENTKPGTKGYQGGRYDIRLAVGMGSVDFFNKTNLGQSDGEAFLLSGRGLDSLKHSAERMVIWCADPVFGDALKPAMLLLDAVIEKWTSNQAEIVYYKLKKLKEEEIATKIGISQSAVNQRTKNSRWNAIETTITWFEKTVKDRLL